MPTFSKLNLPPSTLKLIETDGITKVFDPCRRIYVKLTPEEYVRQSFLNYLTSSLDYPLGLTAIEYPIMINGQRQRADIVVFDRRMKPYLIVECKAPQIPINQAVFNQALRYNTQLGVRYLIVTNGLTHFCAEIDGINSAHLLTQIPKYVNDNSSPDGDK